MEKYPGSFSGDTKVKLCIETEVKSIEFTLLVEWLSKELQANNGLESCVNSITNKDDWNSFLLEVSSFLRELHCPYKCLTSGPIEERLQNNKSKLMLLDFLCTELQASRILQSKIKKENDTNETAETTVFSNLKEALKILNVNSPTDDPMVLLSDMEKEVSSKSDLVLPPALEEELTREQWSTLTQFYDDMYIEYSVRREMLLTRLDVTLQSFKWGERCENKESEILNAYVHRRKLLKREPAVKLHDLIAAREDIFNIEKTSSDALVKNTRSSLNRILIDAVPDRGGRPKEQRPPVEMPNWCKRSAEESSRGGRGGGFPGRARGYHDRGGGGFHGGRHHGKKFKGNKNR